MRGIHGILKFLFIFIALGGLAFYAYEKNLKHLDKKAQLYATDAVTDIVSNWSPQTYKQYVDTAPEQDSKIIAAFAAYSKLGKLTMPVTCGIKDFSTQNGFQGTKLQYLDASYECNTQFQNGPASIDVFIFVLNFVFCNIRYFAVNSPYFFKQPR
jgi:hypothetical protein